MENKVCTVCYEEKPVGEYHTFMRKRRNTINRKSNERYEVVRARCKDCTNRDMRSWRYQKGIFNQEDYKKYLKRRNLFNVYGISMNDYDKLLAEQEGMCAACSGPPTGRGVLHLDHDHETGQIRGLLCHHCNAALGMALDRVERLEMLIAYLDKHKGLI